MRVNPRRHGVARGQNVSSDPVHQRQTKNLLKKGNKRLLTKGRMSKGAPRQIRTRDSIIIIATLSPLSQRLQLPNRQKIFAIYALTLYTVASPDPDPNPWGRGQLPDPNECNSIP